MADAAGATIGEHRVPAPVTGGGRRFRLRFAASVVVVSLIPLALAAWAVGRVVSDSEVEKADASLNGVVRVASTELQDAIRRAAKRSFEAASWNKVKRAVADRDAAELEIFARYHPGIRFLVGGRQIPAAPPGPVVVRTTEVPVREGTKVRSAGLVVGWVALDQTTLSALSDAAGVGSDGLLLVRRGDGVIAGLAGLGEQFSATPGVPTDVSIEGDEYRALAHDVGPRDERLTVVAARTREPIDSAAADAWWNALWAALATLATVALLAYAVAPAAAGRWHRRRRRRAPEELGPLELEALAAPVEGGDGAEAPAAERIPRRIVVIADDPVERQLIADALEVEDVRVSATSDAERALGLLDSEPAGLAVLDWKMSGRSGAEILAELNIRHPDVLVLVITDGLEAQQRHVATLLGAEEFLVRPLDAEDVARKITGLLEQLKTPRAGG